MTTRGWIHPELKLGFEVVSDNLLDGMADRDRIELLEFAPDGEVAVISVEDIIADRMGQFASGTAPDMREQARRLFILHNQADISYMDKRIRYESGGDYGVADLKDESKARHSRRRLCRAHRTPPPGTWHNRPPAQQRRTPDGEQKGLAKGHCGCWGEVVMLMQTRRCYAGFTINKTP